MSLTFQKQVAFLTVGISRKKTPSWTRRDLYEQPYSDKLKLDIISAQLGCFSGTEIEHIPQDQDRALVVVLK